MAKWMTGFLGGIGLLIAGAVGATPVEIIYVGTWSTPGSGNSTAVGGPGIGVGQKFVVKIVYDDTAMALDDQPIQTAIRTDSGQDMRTVDLSTAGHSIDIFVPMPGLDAGSPFIYTQNENTHFSFGPNPPVPGINFENGSDISNTANIIGFEHEGNFVAGAGNNFSQFWTTAADEDAPIEPIMRILNFGVGPAVTSTSIAEASAVSINNSSVVYDAATLMQTTSMTFVSNDLGAARSDGENFLTSTWDVTGTTQANNVDQKVLIEDSGLTMTTSTATWNVTLEEAMTGLSDSAQVAVSYMNATPTAGLSAVMTATGFDFGFAFDDDDLIVNTLIAGFEALSVTVLVNGMASTFFDTLVNTGIMSVTKQDLFDEFGAGIVNLAISVTDKAGEMASVGTMFEVPDLGGMPGDGGMGDGGMGDGGMADGGMADGGMADGGMGDGGTSVPEPSSFMLVLGLLALGLFRRKVLA